MSFIRFRTYIWRTTWAIAVAFMLAAAILFIFSCFGMRGIFIRRVVPVDTAFGSSMLCCRVIFPVAVVIWAMSSTRRHNMSAINTAVFPITVCQFCSCCRWVTARPHRIQSCRCICCIWTARAIWCTCGGTWSRPTEKGITASCRSGWRKSQRYTVSFCLTRGCSGTSVSIIRDCISWRRITFPHSIKRSSRI